MVQKTPAEYRNCIRESGKSIYDPIEIGDPNLWIPTPQLELLLNEGLCGKILKDSRGNSLPNRTRSKVLKSYACAALGYPIPKSFEKTQPRFVGQQFDTYGQQSCNLQIWNEELSLNRRYAIIQISDDDVVLSVRVVSGEKLSHLDTTGTLTTKYQARLDLRGSTHELISISDTAPLLDHVRVGVTFDQKISPVDEPESGKLLSIQEIFHKLSGLVGQKFPDPGMNQERNRGAALHGLICARLGYSRYEDNGRFPDIRHQFLEVKLQTAPTIDLGLILPSSEEPLDVASLGANRIRNCDTRYAVFYGRTDGIEVTLTHLFVTTGADFFGRFPRFEGNVVNRKIQIPLRSDFFVRKTKNLPNQGV